VRSSSQPANPEPRLLEFKRGREASRLLQLLIGSDVSLQHSSEPEALFSPQSGTCTPYLRTVLKEGTAQNADERFLLVFPIVTWLPLVKQNTVRTRRYGTVVPKNELTESAAVQ
jgi:hypothetical protein